MHPSQEQQTVMVSEAPRVQVPRGGPRVGLQGLLKTAEGACPGRSGQGLKHSGTVQGARSSYFVADIGKVQLVSLVG